MTRGPRLLIVDDDAAYGAMLRLLLEDHGYAVAVAPTLREARAALAADDAYDAVLLDRFLPDGVGTDLIAEVRAAAPAAVICLASADALEPGDADLSVSKGSDPDAFIAALSERANAQRTGEGSPPGADGRDKS